VTGVIAVLGFGEAGSLIARDLVAAGAAVRGFDPQGPAPAGDAADRVAGTLRGYGASIEVLDGPAGLAATRKLLRSVFYKGMASSIVEALEAARAAGLEDWLRPHIAEELAKADASTVDRIATGTRQHAVRRGHEMAAAAEMLTDLGVEPIMADASRALHERLAAGENRPPSG
jgi:3-hydroxyisobutyrate dehydrogenase-like beta-hydroxyacid dehydrogenase